jgi:hypothetical protein
MPSKAAFHPAIETVGFQTAFSSKSVQTNGIPLGFFS